MNIKELLLIVGLALATTWSIEYFFFNKRTSGYDPKERSGQSFVAPKVKHELKPLNVEIDFLDKKRSAPPVISEIETDKARFTFSTDGACLERLEFKRKNNNKESIITTIFPFAVTEREKRFFLVALDKKTPYFYELIKRNEDDSTTNLTYQASFSSGIIQKSFKIFHDKNRIDLTVNIKPKPENKEGIEPRIFYSGPIMADIADTDTKSALVGNEKGSVAKIARSTLNVEKGWFSPTIFGSDNRYFVHAMINDPDQFTKRAYYKLSDKNDLVSILEGPVINTATSWTLSFYFGPKEITEMALVDPRLEQTLNYPTILAPIAKFFLKILNFLYDYFKNYGLSIIVLTILIKLLFLPFTMMGGEKSLKKKSEFDRKLQYIQKRYKDDKEVLNRERAELIRKHGMPGLSGCLPILLQLPIFFSLSRVLASSIELYQAPFVFWIKDLSAPDPYYVFPLLIFFSMLLQAVTVEPKMRVQIMVMALVFGAITISLSVGLCLYIFMSTVLSVAQSIIQKKLKVV